jgi:hypothetical protein
MEIWSSVAVTKLLPGIWNMQTNNLKSVSPEIHNHQTKSYKAWISAIFIFKLKFVFTCTWKIHLYGAMQVSKGAQRHRSHPRHKDVLSVHQPNVQQPSTHANPEAASASFRLPMMGDVSPETCWASYKYEIKFWYTVASCWIFYTNYTIMHGSTSIKLSPTFVQTNAKCKLRNFLCNSSH